MIDYELRLDIEKRDNAYARICKAATPFEGGKTSREQAIAKALEADPALYEAYLVEEAKLKRAARNAYIAKNLDN